MDPTYSFTSEELDTMYMLRSLYLDLTAKHKHLIHSAISEQPLPGAEAESDSVSDSDSVILINLNMEDLEHLLNTWKGEPLEPLP